MHRPETDTAKSVVSRFESVLHQKEQRLHAEMIDLASRAKSQSYADLFLNKPSYYDKLYASDGFALLIFENDTLRYWSDNSVALEARTGYVCLDTGIIKMQNGWFEVMKPASNATTPKTVIGLILIKNEYQYQNNYLENSFQKDFGLSPENKISVNTSGATYPVNKQNGVYLFSLELYPGSSVFTGSFYVASILIVIALILIVAALKGLCLSDKQSDMPYDNKRNLRLLVFISIVTVLRYITIKLSFPGLFYHMDLFSPKVYADASSVWLSSLGDLLINVCLFSYVIYTVFLELDVAKLASSFIGKQRVLFAIVGFELFFVFSWMVTSLFVGLIKNSNIPFGINNILTLNAYSYIALVIVGLLLFASFLFADVLLRLLKHLNLSVRQYAFAFVLTVTTHTLTWHLLGTLDLILIFWPVLLLLSVMVILKRNNAYHFASIVFLVFLFSLFAVHVFTKHTAIKERETRKIYAEKLAAERDPVAEFLFKDTEEKLHKDTLLITYINGLEKNTEAFEKRLKQQYFSGFWDKYDVKMALFDSMCIPLMSVPNAMFDNEFYFDDLIQKKGVQTTSSNFFFIKNSNGKISYLAKTPLDQRAASNAKPFMLYLELDAKFISDEIGFPELLLDKNVSLSQELTNYSYAKYKHNKLITQYGKYPYNQNGLTLLSDKQFIIQDNYSHLLYRPDANTLVVLSKKGEGWLGKITTFSYLFTLFSLLLLSILFVRQIVGGSLFENFNFKYRIQLLLVLIVLSSLALFGGGTIYYMSKQFQTKNRENISEKIHSVLIDIDSKLANEQKLDPSLSEYMTFVLKRLSNIFFTDINLYDTDGNLFASSRLKVFDVGLTSKKMNPEAYSQMAVLGKTEFIHDERIGKLEYLSAYIVFKNKEGKELAYLNLPYFSKQSELEKEISGFFVALINIYVLLFALSIILAIFISNYVTKPLKMIQDKLSKIKLGSTNELIDWQEKDEIGSLVSEYNRMILELSRSAELLAKSERESAWREMAKQVAHEIKNPLTPMKLSVQHLQRIWKDDSPDKLQKMERLTQTIIEQIDTLSSIATEFSNFAKMPKANLEKVDLNQVLLNSIALFPDTETIHIKYHNYADNVSCAMADKEQLLRVFNNLLKNAIQAVSEDKKGLIEVSLTKNNSNYLIAVKDNGTGISPDVFDKIFVPNFTTKTGGMGLGLAMVKNIIESVDGKIWFESKENEGATFFVSLPCYK